MSANPLRNDTNGMLREKLQSLGAGTYDPAFMTQFRQVPPMSSASTSPFIQAPNPAENKSQLVKKRMLLYSGDRDDRVGSTPSNFQITLNQTLDDVVKVELRSFQCPSGINNVTASNHHFRMDFVWTLANSDYFIRNPPPTPLPVGWKPPATETQTYSSANLFIPPGSYTDQQFIDAVAKTMNDHVVYYLGRHPIPGQAWISGGIGESGNFELYSYDEGLTFGLRTNSTAVSQAFGTLLGVGSVSNLQAINTGGLYGTTDYYYLVAPNAPGLPDYSVLCLQSIALGNNLVATEGGSAGFNAFTTIPVSDGASPILVRFDNTLDSSYFDVQRNAYNTLRVLDIKITDKDGLEVPILKDITMEFDVVQKIKPGTLGV